MSAFEYERTCNRCQHVWYLSREVVEAKPIKQAKGAGWATPLVGKKRQTIRAEKAMVTAANQQMQQASLCPSCGSGSFTSRTVTI